MPSIISSKTGKMEFISSKDPPPRCTGRTAHGTFLWKSFGHVGTVNDVNKSIRLKVQPVNNWDEWYADLPRDSSGLIKNTF